MESNTSLVPVQNDLDKLSPAILELNQALSGFSSGIATCFSAADASDLIQFKVLRNTIVDDASVYFAVIAPMAKKVFQDIYSTFDLMGEIETIKDFLENIKILIEETQNMSQKVDFVKCLHEEALATAGSRAIEANKLIGELKIDMENVNREAEQLRSEHSDQLNSRVEIPDWVWFVPISGWISGGIASLYNAITQEKADLTAKKVLAKEETAQIQARAISQIVQVICPSLQHYIGNLEKVIFLLNIFIASLNEIHKRSSQGKEEKIEAKLKILFKSVQKNVRAVKSASMAVVTQYDICSQQFKVFESFKGQPSYVQIWLERQISQGKTKSLKQRILEKFRVHEALVQEMNVSVPQLE